MSPPCSIPQTPRHKTHINELKALVWEASSLSQGKHIAPPSRGSALTEAHPDDEDDAHGGHASDARTARDPTSMTLQEIEVAMRGHDGNVSRAAFN